MYRFFRTLHDMFRRVHNMYPHTIIYFVSCTLNLCGPYVASEMTNNSKKIQKFPKKQKNSKKKKKNIANIAKKSLILAFLANLAFLVFFENFWPFGTILAFWDNLGFLGNFWISCSLHIGYKNRT
jgi:p-aminobenzoyl-glutamate transporter AbgT